MGCHGYWSIELLSPSLSLSLSLPLPLSLPPSPSPSLPLPLPLPPSLPSYPVLPLSPILYPQVKILKERQISYQQDKDKSQYILIIFSYHLIRWSTHMYTCTCTFTIIIIWFGCALNFASWKSLRESISHAPLFMLVLLFAISIHTFICSCIALSLYVCISYHYMLLLCSSIYKVFLCL